MQARIYHLHLHVEHAHICDSGPDPFTTPLQIPGNYGPPDMWKGNIPSRGAVSFDYVSSSRPPEEAQAIGA